MIWKKARKKPLVVEFREVEPKEMIGLRYPLSHGAVPTSVHGERIRTPEGDELIALPKRDFIIRGLKGELYTILTPPYTRVLEVIRLTPSCIGRRNCW